MELVTEKVNFEYDLDRITINDDMSNKLFCTFSTESDLDNTLQVIQSKYNIIYNKIFVLYAKSQDEYICTYNVDFGNVSNFLENTTMRYGASSRKGLFQSVPN